MRRLASSTVDNCHILFKISDLFNSIIGFKCNSSFDKIKSNIGLNTVTGKIKFKLGIILPLECLVIDKRDN